jgi:hypothetical protein
LFGSGVLVGTVGIAEPTPSPPPPPLSVTVGAAVQATDKAAVVADWDVLYYLAAAVLAAVAVTTWLISMNAGRTYEAVRTPTHVGRGQHEVPAPPHHPTVSGRDG